MTAEAYNQKKLESGEITPSNITQLVELWQFRHGLEVDGYCGPKTIASLNANSAPVSNFAENALKIAIEELGLGEEGGNNSGPHVAKYKLIEDDGDPDDDGAWCAAFVSWCCEEACRRLDRGLPFKRSQGAKQLFKRIGMCGSFVTEPQPGDVVCWDRGKKGSWQGHIGFVEKVEGGILHTVEGNVGAYPSKVRRFMHDLSRETRLEGFARLPTI